MKTVLLTLLICACAKDPVAPPPRITALPRALTPAEQQLIQADNRFAIKLLKQASADTRDTLANLFVSPLSVAMALAMAYNGAAGTTEDAMRTTMELDSMSVAQVNESYRSLISLLRELDPHVKLEIANSTWYKQGYTVLQRKATPCCSRSSTLITTTMTPACRHWTLPPRRRSTRSTAG